MGIRLIIKFQSDIPGKIVLYLTAISFNYLTAFSPRLYLHFSLFSVRRLRKLERLPTVGKVQVHQGHLQVYRSLPPFPLLRNSANSPQLIIFPKH